MWIVAATFLATLALVFGAYWLFVGRDEAHEARVITDRLNTAKVELARPTIVKHDQPLSSVGPLDWLLARSRWVVGPIRRQLGYAGSNLTPGAILLGSAFFAAIGYLIASRMTVVPALHGMTAAAGAVTPFIVLRYAALKRLGMFEEQFPDSIDLMARSLRAGHALTTALELVGKEAPEPVAGEFRILFERQNYGMTLEDALKGFAERVPLLDARFFVTAVLTQREVGGKLSEVLDNLATVIRERFKVKRQIRVVSAHGRITGWVLGMLPPALATLLLIIAPTHLTSLMEDPIGVRLVVGAIVLQITGVLIMRRIINVEY